VFLQGESWELIHDISKRRSSLLWGPPLTPTRPSQNTVNTLHKNLSVPVPAKCLRVFPTVEKMVKDAKMLERAGAQIITCHGRITGFGSPDMGLDTLASRWG